MLYAIQTLHIRAFAPGWGKVEFSRKKQALHMEAFIFRSFYDIEPPTWQKLKRYFNALLDARMANFSPMSITHLEIVAEETFKEIAA